MAPAKGFIGASQHLASRRHPTSPSVHDSKVHLRMAEDPVVVQLQPLRHPAHGHVAGQDDVAWLNSSALKALRRQAVLAGQEAEEGGKSLCIALKSSSDESVPRW